MRIDRLEVKNLRGFERGVWDFHPHFNLVVGDNGSGKTSLLTAVYNAVDPWLLANQADRPLHATPEDVRHQIFEREGAVNLEPQFPFLVRASGTIAAKAQSWQLLQERPESTIAQEGFTELLRIGREVFAAARAGAEVELPVVFIAGADRIAESTAHARLKADVISRGMKPGSRLAGYGFGVGPGTAFLFRWLEQEQFAALQSGTERAVFRTAKTAMRSCLEGCEELKFDVNQRALLAKMRGHGWVPDRQLSGGQQAMLTLVAAIAIKCAMLNPQLGDRVLEETPGVVIIDELELHLHPRWQRRVVADLKRTFPKVQFFASTHSPQIIANTPREEIILLNADGSWRHPGESKGLNVNEVLRDVMDAPTVNVEASEAMAAARKSVEAADFETAQHAIDTLRELYGDLPELASLEGYMDRMEALSPEET